MNGTSCWRTTLAGICIYALSALNVAAQEAPPHSTFMPDFTKGPRAFPTLLNPYQPQSVPKPSLESSKRLSDLIRDGKLTISLTDALSLALENNLDIAVQRYLTPFAQTDVLRTSAGSSTRGVSGALVPGGLSAGAVGAGVSGSGTGTGTGNAGGISGGGGAVNIGSVGNLDPIANFGFSWDRVTSPLNTLVVAGVPTVTGYATSYSGSYAQLFSTGTSYSVNLSGLRSSSTQRSLLFNPSVTTRMSVSVNQPLLNGLGRDSILRFLIVAKNNQRITQETFRLQVVTTIVQVENTYWDLAAFQESVKVAEQSRAVAQRLYEDNKKQADIGTLAPLDVISAEAELAARERDLVVAQTNLQLQETKLKNILSKKPDTALDAARIVITDRMPEPRDIDIPKLEDALTSAMNNRPDLRQAEGNLQNQKLSVDYTANNMKPNLGVFGLYSGSGLQGNNLAMVAGVGGSLQQSFGGDFPEYAGGLNFNLALRNRSAQADNIRAQLEKGQQEVSLQRSRNQISLEVRQAIIGLQQGKAQVLAAHQAVRLARETFDAEQKKLAAGVSTSYNVILRQRDMTTAQQAEVQAVASYSKALVEMDRAMGSSLDRNGIQYDDALTGTITKSPSPPFSVQGFTTEEKPATR